MIISVFIYRRKHNKNKLFETISTVETVIFTIFMYVIIFLYQNTVDDLIMIATSQEINNIEEWKYNIFIWIIFVFILIVRIASEIFLYISFENKNIDIVSNKITVNNDSILDILEDAGKRGCWNEVILIGSALSEFLWYTGKKELRIKIGDIVQNAAIQTEKHDIEARTLIEDIGITTYIIGDKEKGKDKINKGIEIAYDCENYFLACRGNRHLSCCFTKEGKSKQAKEYLDKAKKDLTKINNEYEKMEAEVSIKYAQFKELFINEDYKNALLLIEECIADYEAIAMKYQDKSKHNYYRIEKMNRYKGDAFNNLQRYHKAQEAYTASCNDSKKNYNYENTLRCCIELIKINRKANETAQEKTNFSIAEDVIKFVDNKKLIEEFNELKDMNFSKTEENDEILVD